MNQLKTLRAFILYFLKKQKGYFITIQLLALGWSIDNTVWPYVLKVLVDKITTFTGDKSDVWYYLMPILIIYASVWVSIDIMFRVGGFMLANVFPRFEANIRMAMFDYVSGHSYDFFANNFAGNISNRISDMTQSATRVMELLIRLFVPAFVALIIAGVVFFTINYLFAILLVGWAFLHIGICIIFAPRCADLSSRHANSRSLLTGKIVDSFANIINVKLFSNRRYEYNYVSTYQKDEMEKHKLSLVVVEKIKIVLALSAMTIPGFVMIWYIIYSWQRNLITVGDVVLIFTMSWNIQHLAWMAGLELPNLFKEIGICQQALSIIKAQHDIRDKEDAHSLVVREGEIKFEDVSFNYLQENTVFNKLNVTIRPGSKVGLVGFSGGGKSTFVNLIMRFFDIDSGAISIDGVNIRDVYVDSLRNQISMIPQNPTLFHRSLKDNIRYGKPDATDEEIIEAAKHAHCHEFISSLSQGYDSLVGERGIKLSGGQRQRVAIARAILDNAPILILDEATSALDSVTEKHIQDALHYLMKNRTTIVIAHRLSTLSKMDRIIVFDNGEIVEEGTHESLLKQGGHYELMWRMQAGGFLADFVA